MDTKALRQKILDLAIHGKLVPQDPTDEPASVLLERIKAEKERLIKEGKIKRSKKSAKTSDTPHYENQDVSEANVPFEEPNSWVWCRLEDIVCELKYGTSEKSSSVGKIAVLRMGNITNVGTIDYSNLVYSSNDEDIEQYSLEKDDLLFNRTNSSEWVGKTAIYKEEQPAIYAGYLIRIRPLLISSDYLNTVMNSGYYRDWCYDVKTDAVNQSNINAQKLSQLMIPIPPLKEQERIVAEMNKWISLIDIVKNGKDDLLTIIKRTKSKILDIAIRGKLVPQDPNDEPAIELLKRINPDFTPCDNGHSRKLPQGWAYCQLSNVLRITMGQSPKGDSLNNKRGIEFHQGKICFSDKFLLKSKVYTDEPTKIAVPNSILLCVRAPVGVVNIAKNRICIGRGLCALTPFEGNADFYFYLLQTLQDSFESQSTGTTFKAISGEVIKNEKFALPPLAEQQRIVQKIEELFSSLDNIQTALEV